MYAGSVSQIAPSTPAGATVHSSAAGAGSSAASSATAPTPEAKTGARRSAAEVRDRFSSFSDSLPRLFLGAWFLSALTFLDGGVSPLVDTIKPEDDAPIRRFFLTFCGRPIVHFQAAAAEMQEFLLSSLKPSTAVSVTKKSAPAAVF